jgi:hypothetical protein
MVPFSYCRCRWSRSSSPYQPVECRSKNRAAALTYGRFSAKPSGHLGGVGAPSLGDQIGRFAEHILSWRTGGLSWTNGDGLRRAALNTQDRSLAEVGNWPATYIDHRAHRVIRHAYEEALTACARLISFSSGGPSIGDGPVTDRQEILAMEDLISFAIHARRLIETTGQKSRFNKIEIVFSTRPIAFPDWQPKLQKIRIWKAITRVIHNQNVEVIRDTRTRAALSRSWMEVILSNLPRGYFAPFAIVKSDEGIIVFPVRELIETFQDKILSPIIDLCSEHHLYLEDLDC